jgi:hypothetical protein
MAIYLSEETSPKITKLLLTNTGLKNIIELAIVSSKFGVHIRDPKTEETVNLIDHWQSGTGLKMIAREKDSGFGWKFEDFEFRAAICCGPCLYCRHWKYHLFFDIISYHIICQKNDIISFISYR